MTVLRFRSLFLYVIAAVFVSEAVVALWNPAWAAGEVGYAIRSTDGLSEFRAVYLGMWSTWAVVAILAARRPEHLILGDIVACAIVCEGLARIVSLVLDGAPGPITYLHLAMELTPVALLVVRPGPELAEVGSS